MALLAPCTVLLIRYFFLSDDVYATAITFAVAIIQYSAPSCDHFGHHGERKKYLATKILADQQIKRETYLKNYQ